MKILLMGGTGAIGAVLANLLAQNPEHNIYVTSRRKKTNLKNITYLNGDAKNLDFLLPVLEENQFDVVCDFMLYSVEELKSRMTELLSKTKHYIFFSSARVYAETKELVDENSNRLLDITDDEEYIRDFEYSLFKAAEENLFTNSTFNNWTIIRPYKTYSNERLQLGVFEKELWLGRVIRGKKVVFIKECLNKFTSLTFAEDTARILEKIIISASTFRKIYNIASPEQVTWQNVIDIYSRCFKEHNKNFQIMYCDDQEMTMMGYVFQNKYRIKYDGLISRKFSDRKVQTEFGPFEWTKVEDGLTLCVNDYLSKYENNVQIIDYRSEGFFDKITGDKEPIHTIPGIKNKCKYILYRYLPYKLYL